LLPLGLFCSFRKRLPLRGALAAAFLCGPVGAAITWGHIPHALRSLPMVVPAAVWGGIGLASIGEAVGAIFRRINPNRAETRRGGLARSVTGIAAAGCFLYAFRTFALYWRLYGEESWVKSPEEGFAYSYRAAFERAFEDGSSDRRGRIWINAAIPYAPYYALFFSKADPRRVEREGLETLGCVFYDPARSETGIREMMAPGDRLIALDSTANAYLWIKPPS
jgi:hypothetical protein